MKALVYIVSAALAVCALSACSPSGGSGDEAVTGEKPAASLTAEEASAYFGSLPTLAADNNTSAASEGAQSQ